MSNPNRAPEKILRGVRRLHLGWMIALAALIALPAIAAAPQFPALTGRVVDEAALLTPAAKNQITGWLAQFEAATKRQLVVVTVKSLQGTPIEDYGYQLGRFWGIGEQGKNTGAILLVAPTEHKVRIEVGYGLEGELTDAVSSTIINQDILPQFRQGNYQAGIEAGTAAILRALGWHGASAAIPPPQRQPRRAHASFNPIALLFFLIMIGLFVSRVFRHRGPGSGSGLGMFMLGSALGGMSGRGGFGGGSFGGGGGGFGGGGGSFGGGGASGSW